MRRRRITVATVAYLVIMSGLAVSPVAEVGGIVTTPPAGLVVAAALLAVHIGYGVATRTFWACAVCLVLPLIPLAFAPFVPADSDVPDYPVGLAYCAVFLAPWVAGLIALGVAMGRRGLVGRRDSAG